MCDEYGLPKWYRHYVYGLAWLGREQLRDQLQVAQAGRMARSTKDDYQTWQRDVLMNIQGV